MIVVHQPTADRVYLQQCVIQAYAWKTAIYRLIPENISVSSLFAINSSDSEHGGESSSDSESLLCLLGHSMSNQRKKIHIYPH